MKNYETSSIFFPIFSNICCALYYCHIRVFRWSRKVVLCSKNIPVANRVKFLGLDHSGFYISQLKSMSGGKYSSSIRFHAVGKYKICTWYCILFPCWHNSLINCCILTIQQTPRENQAEKNFFLRNSDSRTGNCERTNPYKTFSTLTVFLYHLFFKHHTICMRIICN